MLTREQAIEADAILTVQFYNTGGVMVTVIKNRYGPIGTFEADRDVRLGAAGQELFFSWLRLRLSDVDPG